MSVSKNHKKDMSHNEWKKAMNKRKHNALRVEKDRRIGEYVDKLHKRRYSNPLTSPVTKQSFSQRMLKRFGLNKSRKDSV